MDANHLKGWPSTAMAIVLATISSTAAGGQFLDITVGKDPFPACTKASLKEALEYAKERWRAGQGAQIIRMTRDVPGTVWTNQNVKIEGMDVTIIGGFDRCDSATSSGHTYLSGAGGAEDPVITIRDTDNVTLRGLAIFDADADGPDGGAIDFDSRGTLTLEHMYLLNNKGGVGGAIKFVADGAPARLVLRDGVAITDNTAVNGGGISITGDGNHYAEMIAQDEVRLHRNRATGGDGGGLRATDSALVYFQGPGNEFWKNTASGSGGNIAYRGRGEMVLENVRIHEGQATHGGGIFAAGSSGTANIDVRDNVSIDANSASQNGGGLSLESTTALRMVGNETMVYDNGAGQRGGGLHLQAPASALIGAAGPGNGGAVFAYNHARRGGAIAVGGKEARLNLFTAHPDEPMFLQENNASEAGGALYGKRGGGDSNQAMMCVHESSFGGNVAPTGAVAFVDTDTGSSIAAVGPRSSLAFNICLYPDGYVQCLDRDRCNQVVGNRSETSSGVPTAGSLFAAQQVGQGSGGSGLDNGDSLELHRMKVHGNVAGSIAESRIALGVSNLAIYGNTLSGPAVDAYAPLLLDQTTIASNETTAPFMLRVRNTALLRRSILDVPLGQNAVDDSGGALVTQSGLFSSDLIGVPGDVSSWGGGFLDAANSDFRLRPDSCAVDASQADDDPGLVLVDVDGNPRTVDLPVDHGGRRDAGAYELQAPPSANLFRDGFEGMTAAPACL